jgi:hypothetical protein
MVRSGIQDSWSILLVYLTPLSLLHKPRSRTIDKPPNVVVEWLSFLPRIMEVPGSNLGSETDYSSVMFFLSSYRRVSGE